MLRAEAGAPGVSDRLVPVKPAMAGDAARAGPDARGAPQRMTGAAPPVGPAHRSQHAAYRLLEALVSPLSFHGAARAGAALGSVVYAAARMRRRVTDENLSHAFGPALTARERRRLSRRAFRAGGIFFVECLRLPRYRTCLQSLVTVDGLAHLAEARSRGRGAVVFTGHLGNWELIGPALVAAGVPTTLFVGRQKNRLVDDLLNRHRAALGQGVVPLRGGMREAVARLRAGEVMGILVDQRVRRGGVMVEYFGRLAPTSPGAARLALAARAPLVPVEIVRAPDQVRHRVTVHAPLDVPLSGNREADVVAFTQAVTRSVEAMVREAPDQYFWFHRRWRPPAAG